MRPPGNATPSRWKFHSASRTAPPDRLIGPKLIVALGKVAAVNLLKRDASVASLRGKVSNTRARR